MANVMKVFRGAPHSQHGIWSTEIRLRSLSGGRLAKLNKLLARLKEKVTEDV